MTRTIILHITKQNIVHFMSTKTKSLSCSSKSASGQRLGQRARTPERRVLISCQRDVDLPTQPECIIKVEMATGLGPHAVHGDVLDVRSNAIGYCLLHGLRVEVGDHDGRADVEEAVVDSVLRCHWREDEKLCGAWDYKVGKG